MLGGLYIEMAMCQVLGYWLDGSGWTRALLEAGIVTSGRADSFLKASHLTKTHHAHQVTASMEPCSRYDQYIDGVDDSCLSFDE